MQGHKLLDKGQNKRVDNMNAKINFDFLQIKRNCPNKLSQTRSYAFLQKAFSVFEMHYVKSLKAMFADIFKKYF